MHNRLAFNQPVTQWRGGLLAGLFHLGLIYALLVGLGTKSVPVALEPVAANLLPTPPVVKQIPQPLSHTPVMPTRIPLDPLKPIDLVLVEPSRPKPSSAPSDTDTSAKADMKAVLYQGSALTDARLSAGNCTNVQKIGAETSFPERARRMGLNSGSAEVRFTVSATGEVTIDDVVASNRTFESTATDVARHLKCAAGRYVFPLAFSLSD